MIRKSVCRWYPGMLAAIAAAPALQVFSSASLSQESFGRCAVVSISHRLPPIPEVIYSPDGSHLARIELDTTKESWPIWVRIFEFDGQRKYEYVRDVLLGNDEQFPYRKLISDKGRYVSMGKLIYFLEQDDQLRIYDTTGKLAHVIDGKDALTDQQLRESELRYQSSDLCTPTDPWICWDELPILTANEELELIDTLGGRVTINLESGRVQRQHRPDGECTLFD